MSEIKRMKVNEIASKHKNEHDGYEYHQQVFVSIMEQANAFLDYIEVNMDKFAVDS